MQLVEVSDDGADQSFGWVNAEEPSIGLTGITNSGRATGVRFGWLGAVEVDGVVQKVINR